MERRLFVKSVGSGAITAVCYLPPKREIIAGHEDGRMKCWALDGGELTATAHKHVGWVSSLLYWAEGKILFSSSLDSTIVQWSSSFEPFNIIQLDGPVYSLLWNPRKEVLLCGRTSSVGILHMRIGKQASIGLPLLSSRETKMGTHEDIVKCLAMLGNRAFSGGLDRKLVIYEASSHPDSSPLKVIHTQENAHAAGITCMSVNKDSDSSTWLVTGSHDYSVKLWTTEGTLLTSMSFQASVTGLCYVLPTRLLWVATGSAYPHFYEPKLGIDVTQFVPVRDAVPLNRSRRIQFYQYFPEISEVVGYSSLRELLSWRYSHSNTCIIQVPPCEGHIETLSFTNKSPILIFSGSYDGCMTKWERHQLNPFLYNSEDLEYREKLTDFLLEEEAEWNLPNILDEGMRETIFKSRLRENRGRTFIPNEAEKCACQREMMKDNYRGFCRSLYVEEKDCLVASSLDGKIFLWTYDGSNADMLLELQKMDSLPDQQSQEQTSTLRVVGLTCQHVLNGHTGSVSGLVAFSSLSNFNLVSAGWDGRLCVWDLSQEPRLLSRTDFRSGSEGVLREDTIITHLAYSQLHKLVAFSTSNGSIHICGFQGNNMSLKVKATLLGHNNEVTQVAWNPVIGRWVSGSEDATLRLWLPKKSTNMCDQIVSTGGPVSVITMDTTYGLIIAAIGNNIKVYSGELEMLQVYRGHEDTIQAIIHIAELDQYISAGWDRRVRVWHAFHPSKKHHHSAAGGELAEEEVDEEDGAATTQTEDNSSSSDDDQVE